MPSNIVDPIIMISLVTGNSANAPRLLGVLLHPYVDLMEHTVIVDFGALTPGAVATPRRYRPPASWIWWGGDWSTWTALPRWGILHGAYKNFVTTMGTLLDL